MTFLRNVFLHRHDPKELELFFQRISLAVVRGNALSMLFCVFLSHIFTFLWSTEDIKKWAYQVHNGNSTVCMISPIEKNITTSTLVSLQSMISRSCYFPCQNANRENKVTTKKTGIQYYRQYSENWPLCKFSKNDFVKN